MSFLKMRLNYFNDKYLYLCVLCALCGSKNTHLLCGYESIIQNKPNFRSNKMNTTFLLTKDYEQITVNNELTKTNPIKPNFIRLRRIQT